MALEAHTVIPGDREVLTIKEYMGIRILTPQQFFTKLSRVEEVQQHIQGVVIEGVG